MRSRRQILSLALTVPLATALLPGGAQAWNLTFGNGPRVQGSGKLIDEARTLAPFSRIRIDDSLDVQARPGSSQSVVVHADDNLAPLVLTSVEGDTLVVKFKPGVSIRSAGPVQILVQFTQLKGAELRGSGDLAIDGLKGESLDLGLSGSGDVKLRGADVGKLSANLAGSGNVALQGRCTDFNISIAGSGDVRAGELQCKSANVSIAGSGDARVHASESLAVQIAGSGDVSYSGNPPKVSSRVAGSGELHSVH
jgi:hypothetical protein